MDTVAPSNISAEALLEAHLNLCDEVYHLLLEEQSLIRESRALPDEGFLHRKKSLLPRLEASVASLKTIAKVPAALKAKVAIGQQKLMKLFHLIRENERAILNVQTLRSSQQEANKMPNHTQAQPQALKAYKQASASNK